MWVKPEGNVEKCKQLLLGWQHMDEFFNFTLIQFQYFLFNHHFPKIPWGQCI